jgi:hypothetical protein
MAGKIIADTLEHSTAGSLDTSYVVNGSAKAWVSINSTSPAIRGSLNASSLTDEGSAVGVMKVTTTNAFNSSDNMSISSSASNGTTGTSYYKSSGWVNNTSNYWIRAIWGTTGYDVQYVHGQVQGDLA